MSSLPIAPGMPIYVVSGDGKAFWGPGGDKYVFLVTGKESNGSSFVLEATVPPGGGPPPHINHREDEFFYVLQGSLTVYVADKSITATAGDFVHAPRGVIHHYRNDSEVGARMLAIFTPAGMEHWFEECLVPATDRTSSPPAPTPEFIQRMIAAGPKHGVEWG